MDRYTWLTDDDGLIRVTGQDGAERVPTLSGAQAASFDAVDSRWSALAEKVGARWGISPLWLLAMIWQESKGNPAARSFDGGMGLVQITHPSLKAGYADAQLLDPETNLEIGARYVARHLVPRYGLDFPKIAAAYNAGSVRPSSANAWRMHCTGSHIDGEVGALNRAILRRLAEADKLRSDVLAMVYATSDEAVRETVPA